MALNMYSWTVETKGLKEPRRVTERKRVRNFRQEMENGYEKREVGDGERGDRKCAQGIEGKLWSHANLH